MIFKATTFTKAGETEEMMMELMIALKKGSLNSLNAMSVEIIAVFHGGLMKWSWKSKTNEAGGGDTVI